MIGDTIKGLPKTQPLREKRQKKEKDKKNKKISQIQA